MAKVFRPFTLGRPRGDGFEWLEFDTPDGRKAVVVFTEPEKTKRFRLEKGLPADYKVAEMTQPEFLRWLQDNLLGGIPLVMLNPTAQSGKTVEIFRFIAELGGGPDPEPN
jgi:hypothetical protein